jgi:hypothetical protein
MSKFSHTSRKEWLVLNLLIGPSRLLTAEEVAAAHGDTDNETLSSSSTSSPDLGRGEPFNGAAYHNGDAVNGAAEYNTRVGEQSGPQQTFTPIAICGMACRLPGGIKCPQDLWELLLSKGDARGRVPETRYNVSAFHSPTKKPGHTITEHGYFLDDSVDLGALDTSVFPMARSELEGLDPQQRLLFEVSRESLDDAGEVGWRGKNVGVFVGTFGNDWYDLQQKETQRHGTYYISTSHDFNTSNRLSHEMDLRGPRYYLTHSFCPGFDTPMSCSPSYLGARLTDTGKIQTV